jgi:hypothetical protein
MLDVIAAAKFLQPWWTQEIDDDDPDLVRARTVMESGMFVTYARPFTSSAGLQMMSSLKVYAPTYCTCTTSFWPAATRSSHTAT